MTHRTSRRWSKPDTILVATTLPDGPTVMHHGIYQAKLSGAKVLVTYAIRTLPLLTNPDTRMSLAPPDPELRVVQDAMGHWVRTFQQEGIQCEGIILTGVPAEQIPLLAKARDVDLVIAATRSPRGVDRLLMGSLAEELAAVMDVPVCILGHAAQPGPFRVAPPEHILVATSLRPSSSVCMGVAYALAAEHHAHLTVLHVLEPPRHGATQSEAAQIATRQQLAADITEQAAEGYPLDTTIRSGDPATEILEVASSLQPDFIILGSPSDLLVPRMPYSGVIHRVVSEASCPVITVKPADMSL